MVQLMNLFVTEERRAWMRLRDHVVVNERDPVHGTVDAPAVSHPVYIMLTRCQTVSL